MTRRRPARSGMTLLEVVVSMAIFLMSMLAIWQLVNIGSDRALDVKQQARASMLCQSKLSELMVGSEPLQSGDYQSFPPPATQAVDADNDLDGWQYRVTADSQAADGLWSVQVSVKFERVDGRVLEANVNQFVIDPSIRGSTLDQPNAVNGNSASDPDMSGTSPQSTDSSGNPSSSGGGGSAPASKKTATKGATGKGATGTKAGGTGNRTTGQQSGKTATQPAMNAGKANTGNNTGKAAGGKGGGK